MIEAPPPEFEYVILMHFYLKRELIKADVQEWIEEAEKNIPCEYDELIRDHNYAIADEFYANPNEYHLRLVKEAKRLDELLEGIASRLNIQWMCHCLYLQVSPFVPIATTTTTNQPCNDGQGRGMREKQRRCRWKKENKKE